MSGGVCDTCNEAQEQAKSKYGFDSTWIVRSCDPNRKVVDLPNYPYIWSMIREPNPIYRVEKIKDSEKDKITEDMTVLIKGSSNPEFTIESDPPDFFSDEHFKEIKEIEEMLTKAISTDKVQACVLRINPRITPTDP